MELAWQRWSRVVPGLVLGVTVAFTAVQLWLVLGPSGVGIDFTPLRSAATSLLSGKSVYTDPTFVYPPTAAILLIPTSWGSLETAFQWWTVAGIAAVFAAAWLIGRNAARGWRLVMPCIAVLALFDGCAATEAQGLGNLSVFLVPVAVGVVLAWEQDRWTLGCAVLAISFLLKPLLLPLILVPVLRRRWRELGVTMIPAAVMLAAATLLVPGGRGLGRVLLYWLSGTNLHGELAIVNLSIRGWFEARGLPAVAGLAVAVAIALVAAAAIATQLRRRRPLPPASTSILILTTVLLAGALSEVHFLLVVIGLVTAKVARHPTRSTVLLAAPALIMLAMPITLINLVAGGGSARQTWYLIAELSVFAASVVPAFARESAPAGLRPLAAARTGPALDGRAHAGRRDGEVLV